MAEKMLAVYGSSAREGKSFNNELTSKARALGIALSHCSDLNILFGAGSGLPLEVVSIAKEEGASVYGFSPTEDFFQADTLGRQSSGFASREKLEKNTSGVVFLTEASDMTEDSCNQWRKKLGIGNSYLDPSQQRARFVYRSELMNELLAEKGGVALVVGGEPGSGTEREMIGALSEGISVGILREYGRIISTCKILKS